MNIKLRLMNRANSTTRTASVEIIDASQEHLDRILLDVSVFLAAGGLHMTKVQADIEAPDPREINQSVQDALDRIRYGKLPSEVAAAKEGIDAEVSLGEKVIVASGKGPAERPRRLPYVNDERSMGVNLGEMFPGLAELVQEAAEAEGRGENVPHLSGIKFAPEDEGRARLKVRYFCKDQNCGLRSVRYVFDGSSYCKCHACGTRLKLRPASRDQPQDEGGNFFIADQLYIEGMNE